MRHSVGAAHHPLGTRTHRRGVGVQDDLWAQQFQQRLEVAAAGGCQKRGHDRGPADDDVLVTFTECAPS